jgi:hypothetical protein
MLDCIAAPHLRFCPHCIREGFHSTVHQLLSVRFCPVHPTAVLSEACENCGEEIPYAPPVEGRAYRCNFCKIGLWVDSRARRSTRRASEFRPFVEALEIVEWARRSSIDLRFSSINLRAWQIAASEAKPAHVKNIMRYLQRALSGSGVLSDRFSYARVCVSGPIGECSETPIGCFKSYYKAIGRHLRRSLLRRTRGILRSILQANCHEVHQALHERRRSSCLLRLHQLENGVGAARSTLAALRVA